MRTLRRRQRGISLVEAMVALAVMAFGTLAVLGVQTTLRYNGDIAKQRNAAIRIAQERMEQARWVGTLADYQALATAGPAAVAGYDDANTTFTVSFTVQDAEADAGALAPALPSRRKALVVDVAWQDRGGDVQTVRLTSALQGSEPALAGSLSVPADPSFTSNPRGRHPDIPLSAVDQGDGTSLFTPPAGGVTWLFSNVTGFITKTCVGAVCTDVDARLLAGFIRFATAAGAGPIGLDAEVPPSARPIGPTLGVNVGVTAPSVFGVSCVTDNVPTAYVPYFCAVPVDVSTGAYWSGRSTVTGLPLASSIADGDPATYRVCRYTPYRDHRTAPDNMRNSEHPLDYGMVRGSLINQNFLVIRAGSAVAAPFDCPDDEPSTPFVDGTTWHHQPPS